MVERLAESNAEFEHPGRAGWSLEFSAWYNRRSVQYRIEARKYLDREVSSIEIDDEIEVELDAWSV